MNWDTAPQEMEALHQQVAALTKENAVMLDEYRKYVFALDKISQLQNDLAVLTQERDGLITDCVEKETSKNNMWFHLAASKAYAQQLREALVHHVEMTRPIALSTHALTLPTDDTALRERLAEERERCAKVCEEGLCNRPSDPPANYFDGGLRHCAAAIRSMK